MSETQADIALEMMRRGARIMVTALQPGPHPTSVCYEADVCKIIAERAETGSPLDLLASKFEEDSNLQREICCNGQHCGCRGATAGEYVAYKLRTIAKKGNE